MRATVDRERKNLDEKLQTDLTNLQNEIEQAEEEIEELRSALETYESDLSDKNAAFDAARKALNRASRALDEVSKDVSGWVSSLSMTAKRGSSSKLNPFQTCRKMKLKVSHQSDTQFTENADWKI